MEASPDPEVRCLAESIRLERITKEQAERIPECFHKALSLPENCRITGVAGLYYDGTVFRMLPRASPDSGYITFRIASPDFVETLEGGSWPEVQAVYQNRYEATYNPSHGDASMAGFANGSLELSSATSYFLCWKGLAVAVERVYGPDGKEASPLPDDPNLTAGIALEKSIRFREFL